MTHSDLLRTLTTRISTLTSPHPLRVAIDGVDGVGKTTLADELAESVTKLLARPVIRAGVDGFHNPKSIRYQQGRSSPQGYFQDSFDLTALQHELLQPLGPDGSRRYRRAVFDHRNDRPVDCPVEQAADDAVLLLDGVFLHRPELVNSWELSIFLEAPFDVTVKRMAGRDGGDPRPEAAGNRRYVLGQQLYLEQCRPHKLAQVLIDYTDLNNPELLRG